MTEYRAIGYGVCELGSTNVKLRVFSRASLKSGFFHLGLGSIAAHWLLGNLADGLSDESPTGCDRRDRRHLGGISATVTPGEAQSIVGNNQAREGRTVGLFGSWRFRDHMIPCI